MNKEIIRDIVILIMGIILVIFVSWYVVINPNGFLMFTSNNHYIISMIFAFVVGIIISFIIIFGSVFKEKNESKD